MTSRRTFLVAMATVAACTQAVLAVEPASSPAKRSISWEPIGLSGGGAMFTPAISPADGPSTGSGPRAESRGKLMMVNCDMSAAYISRDGGASWQMIPHDQLRSSTQCRPAFHPTDRNIIFAADGGSGLKVSTDGGRHFAPIGNLPGDLCGEIAIDPQQPALMLAGTRREVWLSSDAGKTWQKCRGPRGEAIAFHFDQTSPADRRVCFAATSEGIWRSDDSGQTWAAKSAGLPLAAPKAGQHEEVRHFCGGSNAKDKTVILYCAVPSKAKDGQYSGGLYRSTDRGETWESAMGTGLNADTRAADRWAMGPVAQYHRVLTTDAKPLTVWAFNANTGVQPPHHTAAYRSDDGGRTWRPTFYPDPRFKPFNVQEDYITAADHQFYQDVPTGVAIDPSDAEHVMQVDGGRCYITTDGGKSWRCAHTRQAVGQDSDGKDASWICNGLVVTTTWNYYIDPFQSQRHYICYTDIGFSRSTDAGRTWKWWGPKERAPWANTCYELAFDPTTAGTMWGAFSDVHDIPNANIILGRHGSKGPGGICVSTDFGATWKVCGTGLPAAAALSVVVDGHSPAGSRTLYASMFGHGVFKSADGGKTWQRASAGLGSPADMRTCRLQLHADGTLFVLVTALRSDGRFEPDGPGLYRSTDAAKSWQLVNDSQRLLWPKDFTVDPANSKTIYIGAADAADKKQGGLYRSVDGGATWKLLARKGPEHFGAYLHPKRPGWIYMTLTEDAPQAGLWLSTDNGESWRPMAGLPFANAQRVAFDPANDDVIYVTTFGGSVWRGPAAE